MGKHFSFSMAAYLPAGGIEEASLEDIRRGIGFFEKYCPLDKVYIEPHRGNIDIGTDKIRAVKALFEEHGIATAGGITTTIRIPGHEKNSIFNSFCYSEAAGRDRLVEIVKTTAEIFEEVILDDFYFTACRCPSCIEAKGGKTWAEYRLGLMEDVSKQIIRAARETRPDGRIVIKFPNWYESYQETGYNPEKQKDLFDGIYAGTETRNPKYDQQHLQRYLSYSIVRYLENVSPGRNGGGWIDPFGLSDDISGYVEQAEFTILAKAREMMLFNFFVLIDTGFLPALTPRLARLDSILKQCGEPEGVSQYEPHNADGEDQLVNYLGMTGIPFEPSPEFGGQRSGETDSRGVVFLPASAAKDAAIMQKLEKHVRGGNTAIVTAGFLRECLERGMKDLSSARPTGKTATGNEYWVEPYGAGRKVCAGQTSILLEAIDYKTNATWCEIAMMTSCNSFPLLLHDFYGNGHLYILNVPEDFGDLYSLPAEVTGHLCRIFANGGPYVKGRPRISAFRYRNDVIGIFSLKPYADDIELILPEKYSSLRDMETGELIKAWDETEPRRYPKAEAGASRVARANIPGGGYRFFRFS